MQILDSKTLQQPGFFRLEFFLLCIIIAVAFCNISVFYSFYHYLGIIGIPVPWRGFLVGLQPMAAFVLRLFVLPWLHARNSYSISLISLVLLIGICCSYMWVTTVPSMIVLRFLHGAVFVLLTSAMISLLVTFIPPPRSAQGFSWMTVATMVPFAVIPPLTESLLPYVRNAADIYAGISLLSIIAVLLLAAMRTRLSTALSCMDDVLMRSPRLDEIRLNFRKRTVSVLLLAMFFLYLAHAVTFYFMKNLAVQTGIGHVGSFYTLSITAMILIRLFGSAFFDRTDNTRLIIVSLILMILCLGALPNITSISLYYFSALVYGLGIGAAVPLLSALLFSASAPSLRGFNSNMTLFVIDAGYFLMSYLGGMLNAFGATFDYLFYTAAVFAFLCLSLVMLCRGNPTEGE
jgi:MFS family permease